MTGSEPEWIRSEFVSDGEERSFTSTAGNYVRIEAAPAPKPRRLTVPRWVCRLMHGAWHVNDGPGCRWCSKCGCAR